MQNHGDGTYTQQVRSTTAGNGTFYYTVDGQEGVSSVRVGFDPGEVAASTGTLTADRTTVLADGTDTATLTVEVADVLGNPVAGADVEITVSGPGSLLGSVSNHGDGTYTQQVSSADLGTGTFGFRVDGESGADTVEIEFVPGPVDPAASTVTVDPTGSSPTGPSPPPPPSRC